MTETTQNPTIDQELQAIKLLLRSGDFETAQTQTSAYLEQHEDHPYGMLYLLMSKLHIRFEHQLADHNQPLDKYDEFNIALEEALVSGDSLAERLEKYKKSTAASPASDGFAPFEPFRERAPFSSGRHSHRYADADDDEPSFSDEDDRFGFDRAEYEPSFRRRRRPHIDPDIPSYDEDDDEPVRSSYIPRSDDPRPTQPDSGSISTKNMLGQSEYQRDHHFDRHFMHCRFAEENIARSFFGIGCRDITVITFLDTLESAPERTTDVSLSHDGSVQCWVKDTELFIAADGAVRAYPKCSFLFSGWPKLREIRFNGCFDTSEAIHMQGMFAGCPALTGLDLSSFTTDRVSDMSDMFKDCSELTALDLSSFDTARVSDMSGMFEGCSKLTGLDLSSFDTGNVSNMSGMFEGCSSLTSLDLSSFAPDELQGMAYMFRGCSGLTTLNMFSCNARDIESLSDLFKDCSKLTSLDLSTMRISSADNLSGMFCGCSALTSLKLPAVHGARDVSSMFQDCSSLTSLDLFSIDTSNAQDMSFMFQGCSKLTALDLSDLDTSSAQRMICMFSGCSSLVDLDVSHFNTQHVTDMSGMFCGCSSLTMLKRFSMSSRTLRNVALMFAGCSKLTYLDIVYFQPHEPFNMANVMANCPAHELSFERTPIPEKKPSPVAAFLLDMLVSAMEILSAGWDLFKELLRKLGLLIAHCPLLPRRFRKRLRSFCIRHEDMYDDLDDESCFYEESEDDESYPF